jgi:hypothetical protein
MMVASASYHPYGGRCAARRINNHRQQQWMVCRAYFLTVELASRLHRRAAVAESKSMDRRANPRSDRRKNSRSGRRASDPHGDGRWRRLAWLFAAYAAYLSVRGIPAAVRRVWRRLTPA